MESEEKPRKKVSDLFNEYIATASGLITDADVKGWDPNFLKSRVEYFKTAEPRRSIDSFTISNWSSSGASLALELNKPEYVQLFKNLEAKSLASSEPEDISSTFNDLQAGMLSARNAEGYLKKAVEAVGENPSGKESEVEFYLEHVTKLLESPSEQVFGPASRAVGIVGKLKASIGALVAAVKKFAGMAKETLLGMVESVVHWFSQLILQFFDKLFDFTKKIGQLADKKGFNLKTLAVSVDPPSVQMTNLLGFALPLPQFSLPKIELDFDFKGKAEPTA